MDISEIRALSDADLAAQLVDAKQELWKIRFDLATRQEKNYSRLPATRKRIASLSSKFKGHDEENSAKVGDTVRIEESRPLSRDKRWRVVEVVARGSHEELVG